MNQPAPTAQHEDVRTGTTAEAIRRSVVDHLFYVQGCFPDVATTNDWYLALAHAIRDRLMQHWLTAAQTYLRERSRTVCYLSAEFLLGPHLGNTMLQLGIEEPTREAIESLGLDLDTLLEQEEEPGLGNGGLGRLAACYMESLATCDVPAIGYGIRYEFGIFDQRVVDGWQVETSDTWLRLGNPWEIPRHEIGYAVGLGGHTQHGHDDEGRYRVEWIPDRVVRGIAHDTPILGYATASASLLRLWKSEARDSFDLATFNAGDYAGAVRDKVTSENITKVLYPPDDSLAGKELRLTQQYFFVSCSLQDMIRLHLQRATDLDGFYEKFAAQLNDTHPALAVAELMRLLIDVHGYGWDHAWDITRKTFSYTNHTLLAEALERWPVPLFGALLPRHLEIVYEINARFLEEVRQRFPGDEARAARLSLIDERGPRYVRMAHLACVGSHTVNGVAALHSELLRSTALADFHALWPRKIQNVTNGVTPRRFLAVSNRPLRELITEAIGDGWIRHAEELAGLERFADDPAFQERWLAARRKNKEAFARLLEERTGVRTDPSALLDVQVKRIHEYKRQHLNVLHAITLHHRLRRDPSLATSPRTIVLGGKAAPGYWMAKRIIKLVNAVADVVNRDLRTNHVLKVAFFPEFNVKAAQRIYPAVDLSEQISMAGKEASGTGNMKMALNGALTIGTLDGANVEIREAVGHENFFLFGLTEAQVRARKAAGYHPWEIPELDLELRAVLDAIASGAFSPSEPRLFEPLVQSLLQRDEYMLLADYRDYVETQERVAELYQDSRKWARASILNTARTGHFSSDRSIGEYARNIWRVEPVRPGDARR